MKKGFTLAELLGVIVILGIIALVITPAVANTINDAEEKAYKKQIAVIEQAAMQWGLENIDELPSDEYNIDKIIPLDSLIGFGELQNSSIIDPKTNKEMEGCVVISYNSDYKQHEYNYAQGKNCTLSLATYIKKLYRPTTESLAVGGITYKVDMNHKLIDDRLGGTVESGGNIRFFGATPDNYIDIGDRDSSGNVILWRIIGVFKDIQIVDANGNVTGTEDLVKVIRNDSIGTYAWDNKGSALISNMWDLSRLMMLLNPGYESAKQTPTLYYAYEGSLYWNQRSGNCYYGATTNASVGCNFTSSGLSDAAKSKVERVIWNIGDFVTSTGASVSNVYLGERGNIKYSSGAVTTWPGEVGIMYASDYGYAADLTQCNSNLSGTFSNASCKGTDWLANGTNQWMLTAPINNYMQVFYTASNGSIRTVAVSQGNMNVRPTVFLKSNLSITGTGTTSDGISYYIVG